MVKFTMLTRQKSKNKNKYYAIILSTFTIIIVMIILVLSLVYYLNFEKSALSMIYKSEKDSLDQISNSAVFMCDTAETLAKQVYFDQQVKSLFNSEPEIDDLIKGVQRIQLYSETVPFVDSIYVYNGLNKKFYIYSGTSGTESIEADKFYDKEIVDILDNFQKTKRLNPIPRKVPFFMRKMEFTNTKNAYTFVFYDLPGSNKRLDSAVVINISEDWIKNNIEVMKIKSKNETFIIDKYGRQMLGNNGNDLLADVSSEYYIQKVLKSSNPNGYFIKEIDGKDYLIVYSIVNHLDWIFVQKIPYDSLTHQMQKIQKSTMITCVIILILGLLFSYFASRIIYKPVNQVLGDLIALKNEKRSNETTLKEAALQKMLLGQVELSESSISEFIQKYGMNFDFSKKFFLILIKIDRYNEFCSQYNVKDRGLLKFGILNIASEIFSPLGMNESVDMNDDRMVLISNIGNQENSNNLDHVQYIDKYAKDLQFAIMKYINITVTLSISSIGESCVDIKKLFEKAGQISIYRLFYGYGSILHEFDIDIDTVLNKEYVLSTKEEKRLSDSLLSGNLEAAIKINNEIILEASKFSYKSFNYTLIKLAMIIIDVGDKISQNYEIPSVYNFNQFIGEINQIEVLDDIITAFNRQIDRLEEIISIKKNNKYDEIVKVVEDTINTRYFEPDLNINSLAEIVNLSPGYVGKMFKRSTSISIVDYINNVRVYKAKELLANTSYTVNEIVEKVGFTNTNYFFTLFKKICGITPKEYRLNNSTSTDKKCCRNDVL